MCHGLKITDFPLYDKWGWRSTFISFTRKTIMFKGHFSLLNWNWFVMHNLPRPDFFMHIIDQKLLPRVEHYYKDFTAGFMFPKWLKYFIVMWRKLRVREENHVKNRQTTMELFLPLVSSKSISSLQTSHWRCRVSQSSLYHSFTPFSILYIVTVDHEAYPAVAWS